MTPKQMITELDGYLNHGKRLFAIDLAVAAEAYLRKRPPIKTLRRLRTWLGNDAPDMSDLLARELLDALREMPEVKP